LKTSHPFKHPNTAHAHLKLNSDKMHSSRFIIHGYIWWPINLPRSPSYLVEICMHTLTLFVIATLQQKDWVVCTCTLRIPGVLPWWHSDPVFFCKFLGTDKRNGALSCCMRCTKIKIRTPEISKNHGVEDFQSTSMS
jgi:hypothetical protein